MSTVQGGQGNIVTSGLILNLDAANPRSYPPAYNGTTWFDLSGNSNNGTLTNGPTFNTGSGGAIVFDGVDDYVTGSLPNFNVGSIAMWINPDNIINSSTSAQTLITLRWTGVNNSEWYIGLGSITGLLSNEYITVLDVINDTRTAVADGGSLSANTWCNLVFNLESGTYRIYVNSIKKTEITSGGGVQQLTTPNVLQLGALVRTSVAITFPGRISTTQIYNRSLSSSEINQNFQATRARFGI